MSESLSLKTAAVTVGLGLLLCFTAMKAISSPVTLEDRASNPPPAVLTPIVYEAVAPRGEEISSQATLPTYDRLLVHERGPAYANRTVKRWSHYKQPLTTGPDGLSGNSRRWGDASQPVQCAVIESIISMCRSEGLSKRDTAFVLALVRTESGFNPDAAAGYSSAAGIGQFVDDTRRELARRARIRPTDPFDVPLNVECLRYCIREGFQFAALRSARGSMTFYELVYAYHHDGPSLDSGGRAIARKKVLPWLETAEECID